MLDRIKFSASALIGLAVGICLALPLFWIGVKKSIGSLQHRAEIAFKEVERRQQSMADEVLRLEMNFRRVGAKVPKADFAKVELLRSRLAGDGDFEDKVEISQNLERALLNIGSIYAQTMKKFPAASASAYCREFGLNWVPMMRYLVDEEYQFTSAVKAYNNVLRTPPVPLVISHHSFGNLLSSIFRGIQTGVSAGFKLGWARVRGKEESEYVKSVPPEDHSGKALYHALPEPYYIAQAPVPEEDYEELQYDRIRPDMADIEVGQQKADLEYEVAKPFVAPVPTIQRTATY